MATTFQAQKVTVAVTFNDTTGKTLTLVIYSNGVGAAAIEADAHEAFGKHFVTFTESAIRWPVGVTYTYVGHA